MEQQELIEKIKRLPQDRVAEVESFVDSLARREHNSNRLNLHQALSDYAIQHAGTAADIDPDLEAAATDHLLQQAANNGNAAKFTGPISLLVQDLSSRVDVQSL
jgi:hypothetical protein